MRDIQGKVGKKAGVVIALAAVLVLTVVVFTARPGNGPDENAVLSVSGLNPEDTVDATLRGPQGSYPLDKLHAEHSFTTPQSFTFPYRLDATVKTGGNEYRDMFFAVNKERTSVIVTADGFSPNDRISLDLGNQTVFDSVPLDWSGKIELKAGLKERGAIKACFMIEGESPSLKTCHIIPERRKA